MLLRTDFHLPLLRALFALLALAGCANPGPPRPPSLRLPAVVTDLAAERVGDRVHLAWTSPRQTTDGDAVTGALTAVLCRVSTPLSAARRPGCPVVARLPVQPGASSFDDVLRNDLAAGAPRLVEYRIELLNQAGRSAGQSAPAATLAGEAVAPSGVITLSPVRGGVLVRWAKLPAASPADAMELTRTLQAPAPGGTAKPAGSRLQAPNPLAAKDTPAEVHLLAGDTQAGDPGGTVDRSAHYGDRYRYVGERVRRVTVAGKLLEMRGEPSPPATLLYLDTIAPAPPAGLVAIPIGDPGNGSPAAIDLSWEVSADGDVDGYLVYRSEAAGPFRRVTAQPVRVPAWRDAAVIAGARYRYQVTAIDNSGNESGPCAPVEQAAPR